MKYTTHSSEALNHCPPPESGCFKLQMVVAVETHQDRYLEHLSFRLSNPLYTLGSPLLARAVLSTKV
jgi:hypothetical protein